MKLLEGKTVLVTGVLTDRSIAFHAAALAQREGAQVVLTGVGRSLSLTRRIAQRLPSPAHVIELDVTSDEQLDALAPALREHADQVDGVLHAIAYAPPGALGGQFLQTAWPDVATTLQVSTYSLAALVRAVRPLMSGGGSIVGLDFDASVAWPAYDWMGVAKAGLEATTRYLARDLGRDSIRVNLIAAGPIRTMAAGSIPGFGEYEHVWKERAPLGWDVDDPTPIARAAVAFLSDWLPATTGSIVYVDGGVHALGA